MPKILLYLRQQMSAHGKGGISLKDQEFIDSGEFDRQMKEKLERQMSK